MSKESSHHGDTTENTYTDLGAHTREAFEISEKSRKLARKVIGNQTVEDRIRQRCSVAVGDFAMADLLAFTLDPVNAGIRALERGAPLICDIRMVQVGIQKKGHRSDVLCALDYGSELAIKEGITRTSAGFRSMHDLLDGSVIVIGNAPSALLSVCEIIGQGIVPALVIGTPVGFVNAAESKEELRKMPVPSISNTGTRGGTPVAVAAMNEIITIFSERAKEEEK
jgi:Precorrin isomerase